MKKKMFTVGYVLGFSLIITAHVPADDQAKTFMDRDVTFYYKGDYVTAIADFTDALRLDPNNAYGAKEPLENARKAWGD